MATATASASRPSRPAFDPAAHLTKQGWKGKGTALKNGHLTRPLAVVQKRTLAGVGKDRDEAVPFWDNIFAATAASLSLPTTPSGSGASTPLGNGHRLADPRSSQTSAWQTGGSASASPAPGQPGATRRPALSAMVRVGQETARRGLYSRFFRGKAVVFEPESDSEVKGQGDEEEDERAAGPSSASMAGIPLAVAQKSGGGTGTQTDTPNATETKEERRARRAAKAARKEEKAQRKEARAARRLVKAHARAESSEAGRPVEVAPPGGGGGSADEDGDAPAQVAPGEEQVEVVMERAVDAPSADVEPDKPGLGKRTKEKKKKRDRRVEGGEAAGEVLGPGADGVTADADGGGDKQRRKRRREVG